MTCSQRAMLRNWGKGFTMPRPCQYQGSYTQYAAHGISTARRVWTTIPIPIPSCGLMWNDVGKQLGLFIPRGLGSWLLAEAENIVMVF